MAAPAKPSRSAAVLHIIRAMIEIGRQRLAAVRSQPGPEESRTIARAFGTFNVAMIVARILRGLRIAAALEGRVTAIAPRIDAPPPAHVAASRPSRPHQKRECSDTRDDAALLARMPTDLEIAEMVRRRPIGAVLVDICADLGIGFDHPIWPELKWFIIDHRGLPEAVMERTFQCLNDFRRAIGNGLATDFVFPSESPQSHDTTGPPLLLLAA